MSFSTESAGKRRRIEGGKDDTKESFGKQLELVELENKALRAELEHKKLVNDHKALQTKMEEYQKQLQQTTDECAEMKQLNIKLQSDQKALLERFNALEQKQTANSEQQKAQIAKMGEYQKEQQQKMEEYQNKQQQKMEEYQNKQQQKMEEYQNKQQQNNSDLQKTVVALREIGISLGLTPQNRWDSAACHRRLKLFEPNRLVAQHNGEKEKQSSVRAERPIPTGKFGIFYYEVKMLGIGGDGVHIGLGTKQMPLDEWVGFHKGTYAYGNVGTFGGHAVAGCSHARRNGRPYIKGKAEFVEGDVIGCGVDLATRQIIYTKNGQRLETTGLRVDSAADLFPCVTLSDSVDKIEANFGPNFKFNIAADGI